MTEITLYSGAPMDNTYTHVFDYIHNGSPDSLLKDLKSVTESNLSYQNINKPIRWNTIGSSYEDLLQYNYLTIKQHGKTYYCFISKFNYLNDAVTEIYFDVDLWTTYYKQIDFNTKCLIERCTIPQVFDSDDVKRMMSLDDPMLPNSTPQRTVKLLQIGDPYDKLLIVHVMPNKNGDERGLGTTSMVNGIRTYGGIVSLHVGAMDHELINSFSIYNFVNGVSGSNIVGAELLDMPQDNILGSELEIDGSMNNLGYSFIDNDKININIKTSNVDSKGAGSVGAGATQYSSVKVNSNFKKDNVSYSVNYDPHHLYHINKKHFVNKYNVGTLKEFFKKIPANNLKLLSQPFTSLRIDTRYGNHKDYDLSSSDGGMITISTRESIGPNTNVYYYFEGLGGSSSKNGYFNVFVDTTNRNVMIPTSHAVTNYYTQIYNNMISSLNNDIRTRNAIMNTVGNGVTNANNDNLNYLNSNIEYNTAMAQADLGGIDNVVDGDIASAFAAAGRSMIDATVYKLKADNANQVQNINHQNTYNFGINVDEDSGLMTEAQLAAGLKDANYISDTVQTGSFGDYLAKLNSGLQPAVYLVLSDFGKYKACDSLLSKYGNFICKSGVVGDRMKSTAENEGYTYLKTNNCYLSGSAPYSVKKLMSNQFNTGISIYHDKKLFKERSY